MGTSRASLPDPPGIGLTVILLVACVLLPLNSVVSAATYQTFATGWLASPRIGQPILFLAPLILLVIELSLFALLGRLLRRTPRG